MKRFMGSKKSLMLVGIVGITTMSAVLDTNVLASSIGQEEAYDISIDNQESKNEWSSIEMENVCKEEVQEKDSIADGDTDKSFVPTEIDEKDNAEIKNKELEKSNLKEKEIEGKELEKTKVKEKKTDNTNKNTNKNIKDFSQLNKKETDVKMLKNSIEKFKNMEFVEEGSVDEEDLSIEGYDLDNAYQVYLLDTLVLSEYSKKNSFAEAITDSCQWKIPIVTVDGENGVVIYNKINDKLELSSEVIGNVVNHTLWDVEKITSLFSKEFNNEVIKDITYTYSELYKATFIYVVTDKGEYIIPFTNNEEVLGFENGNVYTISKWFDIMDKRFDEEEIAGKKDIYGGMPFKEDGIDYPINWFKIVISYAVSALTILGSATVLLKKKKADCGND